MLFYDVVETARYRCRHVLYTKAETLPLWEHRSVALLTFRESSDSFDVTTLNRSSLSLPTTYNKTVVDTNAVDFPRIDVTTTGLSMVGLTMTQVFSNLLVSVELHTIAPQSLQEMGEIL